MTSSTPIFYDATTRAMKLGFISSEAPPASATAPRPRKETIYHLIFIPGNPGLIAYYTHFLRTLCLQLNSSAVLQKLGIRTALDGNSLAGFELGGYHSWLDWRYGSQRRSQSPILLRGQIKQLKEGIRYYSEGHCEPVRIDPVHGEVPLEHKIILIGHSIGSYFALSLLAESTSPAAVRPETPKTLTTPAAILLFPTISELASSPRGRIVTPFLRSEVLTWIIVVVARSLLDLLLFILGGSRFDTLVGLVTGLNGNAARVTGAFLKSKGRIWGGCVAQAIFMGRDELLTVREDKWDERVWGASTATENGSSASNPRLFFYFGKEDHWVSERTRTDLIAARGSYHERGGPWMEIDQTGAPHSFCVTEEYSEVVALKCRDYIERLAEEEHKPRTA